MEGCGERGLGLWQVCSVARAVESVQRATQLTFRGGLEGQIKALRFPQA